MKGTWNVDTDIDLIAIAQLKENNEEHPQFECAVDFSILGVPGAYTGSVDLFRIGLTQNEQVVANGPAGIRVGLNGANGGTFTARGRLGGSVGPYASLWNSVAGASNATVWLRLSIDPFNDVNMAAIRHLDEPATLWF